MSSVTVAHRLWRIAASVIPCDTSLQAVTSDRQWQGLTSDRWCLGVSQSALAGREPHPRRYSGDWFEGERSGHGTWTGPTGDDYQVMAVGPGLTRSL